MKGQRGKTCPDPLNLSILYCSLQVKGGRETVVWRLRIPGGMIDVNGCVADSHNVACFAPRWIPLSWKLNVGR